MWVVVFFFLFKKLTIPSSSLGNFVLLLTCFCTLSALAQWLKGQKQHLGVALTPQQGKAHILLPLRRVQGKLQASKERTAQPCPQVQGAAGPGTEAISVTAPEDSLSDRCVGSY